MLFSGKIPFHVAARLTPRFWVPHLLQFSTNSPLFAIVRHYSHYSRLFALCVLFAIRYSGLFAVRYLRLFAIRYSGFPDPRHQGCRSLLPSHGGQASHVGKRGENDVFENNLFNLVVKTEGKNNVKSDFSLRLKPSLCPYAWLRHMLIIHHQASLWRHFLKLSLPSCCFHVGIRFIFAALGISLW